MAKTKYGHLVKKLNYNKLPGAGKPEYITWPKGTDLEGLNLNFVWSYHRNVGPWGVGGKYGHVHPYGEVFVFTGLDYDNPNTLGAELTLALGEDGEEHIIAAPSIVVLPKGVSHCPIVARKVDKPYGFLGISCNAEDKTSELTKRGKAFPLVNKYGDLITRMELRDMKRTKGGNADYIGFWTGKNTPGFKLNFTWAFHKGTGVWHEQDPHVHPNDEALVFVGLDPDKPDYLGAEMEIRMGEEQEVHVFNTPTVVIAPKGLVHCPLITRKVEKPYSFTAICLNNEHETTWLGAKLK
ncbi:MAG: hypothetical protein A2Y58_02145 [Chloroflexi bacterium RBG_13_51_52]|nr:MAG: hypothetical protein A2Y58_02145 [Chloroflexi bacterium RBG_13_51_52]